MDAGVFGRGPYAVSYGIGSQSSHHPKIPVSVGPKWLLSRFTDESHLGYYSTCRRKIRCEVQSETLRCDDKVMEKKMNKVLKKRSKLLKNLSKDLSTLTQIGFGLDCSNPSDLLDQDQEKKISEAAEILLTQLQKLRAEEKKKKCKEDSSSSSSESSDSECEGVVNMKKAPLMLSSTITKEEVIPDSIISLAKATDSINMKDDESTGKKIEVCMGGKCKKSGAGIILEELERVVGMEGTVSGCKCLGKCKLGPNLRLSDNGVVDSRSLCLGVAIEDVSLIANNFLQGNAQELGLAAAS